MITSAWILRGEFRGSTSYTPDDLHDGLSPNARIGLINIAYVCPSCGDLWSRLYHEATCPHTVEWVAHMRKCERCGGGTLLGDLQKRISPSRLAITYPPEFLQHERNHMK